MLVPQSVTDKIGSEPLADRGLPPLFAGLLFALAVLALSCGGAGARLPMYTDVAPGEPLPIDGDWWLKEDGKRYRIERGRIWILESSSLGSSRYEAGHTVARDIFQIAPNQYRGTSLTLSATSTYTAQGDLLRVVVLTDTGPVNHTFSPLRLDSPSWYANQIAADTFVSRSTLTDEPATARARSGATRFANPGPLDAVDPLSPNTADSASAAPPADRASFGRYHALVIGNNNYQSLTKLVTAQNDARVVSSVLRDSYGFQVTLLENATRAQILTSLRRLREALTATDNLVIYYAGHGWFDEEAGEGYWLPVDAEKDSDINWIANATITAYLRSFQAKHVLVVADSCYSGALSRGLKLKVKASGYFERITRQRARIVLSSGGLEPVADGGGGKHSVFARYFIEALTGNDDIIDATTLHSDIRRPVMLAADQVPDLSDIRKAGHEGGDFLFVRIRH